MSARQGLFYCIYFVKPIFLFFLYFKQRLAPSVLIITQVQSERDNVYKGSGGARQRKQKNQDPGLRFFWFFRAVQILGKAKKKLLCRRRKKEIKNIIGQIYMKNN
jgi:hypothetical protein